MLESIGTLYPVSKTGIICFGVDILAVSVLITTITFPDFLQDYILGMTALSITVTVGVKIYNLFTKNKDNKKI